MKQRPTVVLRLADADKRDFVVRQLQRRGYRIPARALKALRDEEVTDLDTAIPIALAYHGIDRRSDAPESWADVIQDVLAELAKHRSRFWRVASRLWQAGHPRSPVGELDPAHLHSVGHEVDDDADDATIGSCLEGHGYDPNPSTSTDDCFPADEAATAGDDTATPDPTVDASTSGEPTEDDTSGDSTAAGGGTDETPVVVDADGAQDDRNGDGGSSSPSGGNNMSTPRFIIPDIYDPEKQHDHNPNQPPTQPRSPDSDTPVTPQEYEAYLEALRTWEANELQEATYHAIRQALSAAFGFDATALPDVLADLGTNGDSIEPSTNTSLAYFVTVYGLMLLDGRADPLSRRAQRTQRLAGDSAGYSTSFFASPGDSVDPPTVAYKERWYSAGFMADLVSRVQKYKTNAELFNRVFTILFEEADARASVDSSIARLFARHVAEIGAHLVDQRIGPDDPHLRHRVITELTHVLGASTDGRSASIDVTLPDLDIMSESSSTDIDPDNVRALAAIYFAAMLEELKFFQVADKLAEQFTLGMLPISRGTGGERIYEYIRGATNRLTEIERRSLYSRTFGIVGGAVEDEMPNRDFSDLWLRFLSAVSLFNRQVKYEKALVSAPQVHKTARDLAVNVSLHGYGIAHFAAVELQRLINDVLEMQRNADVLNAFGVRDVWQLIDRVSVLYLGGSVNGVRQRTMAQTGSRVLQFLASHSALLSNPYSLSIERVFRDADLVDNVERWLAVTGTNDRTVEQFSEPVAVQSQPTLPTLSLARIPDQLQQAIKDVGNLNLGPAVGQA